MPSDHFDRPRPCARRVSARAWSIPAHPLALTAGGALDERHQRGADSLLPRRRRRRACRRRSHHAVRHSRRAVGLFEPVLTLAAEEMTRADARPDVPVVRIGGICGRTGAGRLREAALLRDLGYHAGLLSLAALKPTRRTTRCIAHCRAVAEVIPLVGLLPAAGGRRPPAVVRVLAALRRDPERRRHQDRAVQPLSDARRRARRGRVRTRRHRPLHRQRRQHRGRPAHALSAIRATVRR